MIRPWQAWAVFAACLALAVAALGWMATSVFRLEAAEEKARERADLEESVRLALWRMDSALASLIAEENSRPYFAYASFYPRNGPYAAMFAAGASAEALLPSPLLLEERPHLLLHFQFDPRGGLTSPQAPGETSAGMALLSSLPPERLEASEKRLLALAGLVTRDGLLQALPPGSPPVQAAGGAPESPRQDLAGAGDPRTSDQAQSARNTREYQARASNVQPRVGSSVYRPSSSSAQAAAPPRPAAPPRSGASAAGAGPALLEVREGLMQPVWVGPELFLARRVRIGREEYVQGAWVDWPGLKRSLLESTSDLLPRAELEPLRSPPGEGSSRMLASLPVLLLTEEAPPGAERTATGPDSARGLTPIRLSLLLAAGCLGLTAAAVAALLGGTLSLSERRGAFVSAVTHELRTPLTTLRMYAEMLSSGMVQEEAQRRSYLGTLCTEADRLGHLVANVLAYARLERGSAGSEVRAEVVKELLERCSTRLRERAGQAGLKIVLEGTEEALEARAVASAGHLEQVLFNLVDNACKYAAGASDRRLHLAAEHAGQKLLIRVRDHGPGISPARARRLFRPFSKSAREAASSAPGVGLGLALSRRLARAMGGDLRFDPTVKDGACFVLWLEAAEAER